jgi:hypothetical protein
MKNLRRAAKKPTQTDTLNGEAVNVTEYIITDIVVNLDDEVHLMKSLVVNDDNHALLFTQCVITDTNQGIF